MEDVAVGYDRCLRLFDINRPGDNALALLKTRVKRRDPDGQRGAISVIEEVPQKYELPHESFSSFYSALFQIEDGPCSCVRW